MASPYNSIGYKKTDKRQGRFHNSLSERKIRMFKELALTKEMKSIPVSPNDTPMNFTMRQSSFDMFQSRQRRASAMQMNEQTNHYEKDMPR